MICVLCLAGGMKSSARKNRKHPVRPCDTLEVPFIQTVGFDNFEIDSVLVKIYTKNSNFIGTTDSFYANHGSSGTLNFNKDSNPVHRIFTYNDIEVILKNNTHFRISDIKVGYLRTQHKGGYYCTILGCKVNNNSRPYIIIDKNNIYVY